MEDDHLTPELLPVDVSEELQAMLDKYPLPQGIMDADCNQAEIAQALNTTVNTVAKWITTEGMPVAQAGGNGKAYVLRLSHCWAWRQAREAEQNLRNRHNRDQIAALQASFLGLTVDDPQSAMTPQQRKEAAQADIMWSKAAHMRRQLVPLSDVVDLIESLFRIMREGIEALPDRLERELGLRPDQVAAVVRFGDDVLRSMSDRIEEGELHEQDVPEVEVQKQWVI